MGCGRWLLSLALFSSALAGQAQKIVYSEPDRDDTRRMIFDVAGKINGNFLIYKNVHNRDWIVVFDNDMKEIGRVEQDYVPDNDRMINVDFFPYGDYCYMIYQYQKKNIVYCVASRIDGSGKKIGDIVQLDTTQIGFAANNKIYTVITSEDRSKIMVFKINTKNKRNYAMTTILFDEHLALQKKSRMFIAMDDHNDYLGEFYLDNDGDLVFSKFYRNGYDNINQAAFVIKKAQSDNLDFHELKIERNFLDEIHIKVDNYNKRYFLTSFYYLQRKGSIDGYYFYVWDKSAGQPVIEKTSSFSDEIRKDARGNASTKMAFNDFFIRNIITRKDGGFIIGSESYYTTSRFNTWNRWDYMYGNRYLSPLDNYYYSPYYNNYSWGNRMNNNQSVRYHADNIAVISFNKDGQQEWGNVIGKEQYDDESDDLMSYDVMNTGGQLHFLFNLQERNNKLLNDYGLTAEGQLSHNPTLKNLDKGYDFMVKYGKQVSSRQMIVPCLYRNYICFAKIDYN